MLVLLQDQGVDFLFNDNDELCTLDENNNPCVVDENNNPYTVHEIPDEIGVLILADPTMGELTTNGLSLNELNTTLSFFVDDLLTEGLKLDDLQSIRDYFRKKGSASQKSIDVATKMIQQYNEEIPRENVGLGDISWLLP